MASSAETAVYQFFFLFAGPLLWCSWGLWFVVASYEALFFSFPHSWSMRKDLLFPSEVNQISAPVFYTTLQLLGIALIFAVGMFLIGMRLGINGVSTINLAVSTLAVLGWLIIYGLYDYKYRLYGLTWGIVLTYLFFIVYICVALFFLFRFATNSSSNLRQAFETSGKTNLFEIYFLWILPVCCICVGLAMVIVPESFSRWTFPGFQFDQPRVFSHPLFIVAVRWLGLAEISGSVYYRMALGKADSRRSVRILALLFFVSIAAIIAFCSHYLYGRAQGGAMFGPLFIIISWIVTVVLCLVYLWALLFGGFSRAKDGSSSNAMYPVNPAPYTYSA